MNKNSKILFLGLTLLILFISVGSISATNDTTTTTISDDATINVQNDIIKEKSEVKNSEKIKEVNPVNKNKTQKQIKTDKQPKKSVETTTTVNNYETLKNTWNTIKTDGDNTTNYIINIKKWKLQIHRRTNNNKYIKHQINNNQRRRC